MTHLRPFLFVVVSFLMATTGGAQAFSSDPAALMQRIERLEQRLSTVESLRAAGGSSFSPAPTGSALADVQNHILQMERENAEVNGSVERMAHSLDRLAKRMDDLAKDFDLRVQDLEKQRGAAPTQPATPGPESAAEGTQSHAVAEQGSVVAASTGKTTGAVTAPAAGKLAAVPAGLTPQDHYNKAYAFLMGADYPNARAWLEDFLKKYPKEALADQAYYWLGEVYLVQNNPQAAVVSFKNGLQAFPKGTKAPADLLKMGVALQQLNKPEFSKAAWEKLTRDFPKAPEADKARAKLAELAAKKPAPAKP